MNLASMHVRIFIRSARAGTFKRSGRYTLVCAQPRLLNQLARLLESVTSLRCPAPDRAQQRRSSRAVAAVTAAAIAEVATDQSAAGCS
jgi:hypothetical protein